MLTLGLMPLMCGTSFIIIQKQTLPLEQHYYLPIIYLHTSVDLHLVYLIQLICKVAPLPVMGFIVAPSTVTIVVSSMQTEE